MDSLVSNPRTRARAFHILHLANRGNTQDLLDLYPIQK